MSTEPQKKRKVGGDGNGGTDGTTTSLVAILAEMKDMKEDDYLVWMISKRNVKHNRRIWMSWREKQIS